MRPLDGDDLKSAADCRLKTLRTYGGPTDSGDLTDLLPEAAGLDVLPSSSSCTTLVLSPGSKFLATVELLTRKANVSTSRMGPAATTAQATDPRLHRPPPAGDPRLRR